MVKYKLDMIIFSMRRDIMDKGFKERIKVEPKKDTLSYPFGAEEMLLEKELKRLENDNKKQIEEK